MSTVAKQTSDERFHLRLSSRRAGGWFTGKPPLRWRCTSLVTYGTRAMITVSRMLLALVFAPVLTIAAAQQPKAVRIGYLAAVSLAADAPRLEAFKQGLRELGYVEGRDVV